ncbi:hypothetical protein [Chromobacterium paludis]|uniref:Uncharacterized protein n=1 Tax=Chromobacterium paludis TaxID=2605945 RepID=A0A5C1DIJ0_9NEIS|nr:hypothetical protein [Chromobacterium paludis]QEL56605.1 hypothetical protein FYK34_14040 [Chromobacterium paludis]
MSQDKQIVASISLVKYSDGSFEFTRFGDATSMMEKIEAAEARIAKRLPAEVSPKTKHHSKHARKVAVSAA